jgi:hypothetical protein
MSTRIVHAGKGVPMMPATRGGNRSRQWDLDGLIDGDNVTTQTSNGTSHATGTGWNYQYPYDMPQLPENETHPGGRSNRTGE